MAKKNAFNMTLEEKLEMVRKSVRAITRNFKNSRLIVGPPGLGKSFTVIDEVNREVELAAKDGKVLKYQVITGGVKDAISFYAMLCDYNDPNLIVILDDINTAITDKDSREILRAAVANEPERIISFLGSNKVKRGANNVVQGLKGIHFNKVKFRSKIILISNIPSKKIDAAILSRMSPIEIDATPTDLFEWVGLNLENIQHEAMIPMEWKQEVHDFIRNDIGLNNVATFDFRVFMDCLLWRRSCVEIVGHDLRGDAIYDVDPIWKKYVKMLVS